MKKKNWTQYVDKDTLNSFIVDFVLFDAESNIRSHTILLEAHHANLSKIVIDQK